MTYLTAQAPVVVPVDPFGGGDLDVGERPPGATPVSTHLAVENIAASIGSVGDAYDNSLMESAIGLYKTELIYRHGPWRTLTDIELRVP